MRVLVVDDDERVGDVFAGYLRVLGHEAVLVSSAEAALESLVRERLDAVLLDIRLPGMSGLDFLRVCADRGPDLPIVAISGVATETQAYDCLRFGALEFVRKPIGIDEMQMVLERLQAHVRRDDTEDRSEVASRRASPRVRVALPVRIVDPGGREWSAKSVDLGPFGIKIDVRIPMQQYQIARLFLTLPDGAPPLQLAALLVRDAPDGQAFFLATATNNDLARLKNFLARVNPDARVD